MNLKEKQYSIQTEYKSSLEFTAKCTPEIIKKSFDELNNEMRLLPLLPIVSCDFV